MSKNFKNLDDGLNRTCSFVYLICHTFEKQLEFKIGYMYFFLNMALIETRRRRKCISSTTVLFTGKLQEIKLNTFAIRYYSITDFMRFNPSIIFSREVAYESRIYSCVSPAIFGPKDVLGRTATLPSCSIFC